MTNLKQAKKEGKLADFIKEHEKDSCGDEDAFNAVIDSTCGKSKSTQETSSQDSSERSSDTQTP